MSNGVNPIIGIDARKLRLMVLVPAGWIVFFSLVPDFLARMLGYNISWVQGLSWGIGIILLSGYAGYLIERVRTERSTTLLICAGVLLLVVSEVFRILKSTALIDGIVTGDHVNKLRAIDNLINGLGLLLIAFAFFDTIITLFVSRHELSVHRRQLLDEVERRKQTENDLRKREVLLDGITASAFDGIIMMDNAGRVEYWNPSAERILGYRAEEVAGKPLHELLVPLSQRPQCLEGIAVWKRTGQGPVIGKTLPLKGIHRSAAEIDLELSVSSFQIAEEWHAVGILRDVTQRKLAEETLRLFKIALEQVGDGVGITDLQGNILFVNNAWAAMHGRNVDEVLGRHLSVFHTPDQLSRDVNPVLEQVLKEGSHLAEVGHCRKDESCFQTAMSVTQLRDGNGDATGFIGIARDITDLKDAQRLLEQQRAVAFESARLASLGLMASGIAHEINNPLAVIAASAEKLEDYLSTTQTNEIVVGRLLPMIQNNITRITKVVRGLRSLSRDARGEPFESASVDNIIGDVVELCRERFRLHDVDLRIPGSIPPVEVECRTSEIGQVILNLLNNAFDAVRESSTRWVEISVADLGEEAEIAVEDSGLGIPTEVAEKIFLPFFTTKHKEHGLGVGLSISQSIIEAHHGILSLDATSDHTRFAMRLPKRQSSPPNAA